MLIGKVVPWDSWQSWLQIKQALCNGTADHLPGALIVVNAWRCRGRLPLSIDVHAALLEALNRDTASGSSAQAPEMQLRLELAMSIIRLVNGVSDSAQKGKVASSVAALANDAGLPRILVDIRHEASHNELPSLPVLRLAAHEAVQWLREYYWERQARHLQNTYNKMVSLLKELVANRQAAVLQSFQNPRGLADCGTDDENDDEETSNTNPAASPREGLKQKRSILGELKELLHPSATHILATAILDHDLLPSPTGGEFVNRREGALVESVIKSLAAWFPELQVALLVGAVRKLLGIQPDTVIPSPQLSRNGAEVCLAWIKWFLADEKSVTKAKSSYDSGLWKPSPAQIAALYADCLRHTPIIKGEFNPKDRLLELLTAVLPQHQTPDSALKSEARSPSHSSKKRSREDSAPDHSELSGQDEAVDIDDATYPVETNEIAAQSTARNTEESMKLEQQGEVKTERRATEPNFAAFHDSVNLEIEGQLADLSKAIAAKQVQNASSNHSRSRWKQAENWQSCALGNLPSAYFSNGTASKLDGKKLQLYQ